MQMDHLVRHLLSVVFTLFCLTGSTMAQPRTTPQENMIWTDQPASADGPTQFVAFRKTFELGHRLTSAELRIFADARYMLWINGHYIARGPVRFDPIAPEYDVIDAGEHLRQGRNAIAVLVMGRASNGQIMRHAPGLGAELLCHSGNRQQTILTDQTWVWTDQTGYGPPHVSWGFWLDRMDARRDRALGDWTALTYDASRWKPARPVDGKLWGPIRPRFMPLLRETPVSARPVGDRPMPVTLTAGEEVTLDAGKMVQAYLLMEFDAAEGAELEFEVGERFHSGGIQDTYGAKTQYRARAGRQTYMSTGSFGCRYIVIRARSGTATLHKVTFVDRRYPYEEVGQFNSSDRFLNGLWKRAVHTVLICSEDGYLDCGLREKAEWMGDAAVVEYPVSRVTVAGPREGNKPPRSDAGLMKSMIRHIAQSQTPDGRLKAHHPSDRWDIHGYIEDYACLWVQSLREVYDHTGDAALVCEVWPNLVRQMAWFLDRRSERGLVKAREFVIFDNPLKYKTCEGATLNAFIYRALLDAAYLGDAIGEASRAQAYRTAAGELAQNFNKHLWNEQAGTYYAAIGEDGAPVAPTTHSALLPLNRGIVPADRRERVAQWLWKHESGVGMPYTHYWLFEEQYRADSPDLDLAALNAMRHRWAGVMKRTDTGTLTESYDGGAACHNFGAVPAYFLSAYVLGVRMEAPAREKRLLIEPRPGDLTFAQGAVVTELGVVPISWKRDTERLSMTVTIPEGATATVRLPRPGAAQQVEVNGKPHDAQAIGRWLQFELPAGTYELSISAEK